MQLDLVFYFQKALASSLSTIIVNFMMKTYCLDKLWLHDDSWDTADNRVLGNISLLFSIKNKKKS
jgi:hypothetical protein